MEQYWAGIFSKRKAKFFAASQNLAIAYLIPWSRKSSEELQLISVPTEYLYKQWIPISEEEYKALNNGRDFYLRLEKARDNYFENIKK